MTKAKETKTTENKFTKSQVLASKKLNYSKDLINAILEDDKAYTLEEVEIKINKYLKGEVDPKKDKRKVK
ncbi:hypothetical protein ACR77J_16610 [Tissierella praeacuta]|uniref:hypothetical protein n=1 Tax=Tissierella praeacuta TaxID=43131 RepID=UPI003DA2F229